MSTTHQDPSARKPLRIWPGVAAAAILLLLRYGVPAIIPDGSSYGMLGALAMGVVILLWWLFFSRAPWIERIGAVVVIVVAAVLTRLVVHESIAGGFMGLMVFVYALPATVPLALVIWAVGTRHLTDTARRVTMVLAIVLGCAVWMLVRSDGVISGRAQIRWRWTPTAEERLLAREGAAPIVAPPVTVPPVPAVQPASPSTPAALDPVATKKDEDPKAVVPAPPDPLPAAWPGFRGSERNAVVRDLRIQTDWTTSQPVEIWRRAVGPGWSSFAVHGDYIYTQEQRGDNESVSAYRLSTGEPVWRHGDEVRFYESNGGAGPRGTPTVHRDRVYSLGATGVVNALDARTGKRIWTRNAETDTEAPRPGWGFAASPLIVGDSLIVAASGRLIAYELATGTPRWKRTTGGGGYSSPHLATIGGTTQVLLMSGGGITSVDPATGDVLWDVKGEGVSIVQPWVLADGEVLIAAGDMMGGTGLRRLHAARQGGTWAWQERWTSRGLKPYFNDFVVHKGHAYGFDGTILSAINLETGERVWKGGRYGAGQMLLLPQQDLLLVVSEEGDLVLVAASPDQHTEIAKFKAIEGKTWNHPVLVGDVLLVRNGEEMAAFRLPR